MLLCGLICGFWAGLWWAAWLRSLYTYPDTANETNGRREMPHWSRRGP